MTDDHVLRPGGLQTVASLVLGGAATALVAAAAPIDTEIGGRLAVASLAFFVVALIVGAPRFVGLSTIPFLGAALAAGSTTDPAWVRSVVIGSLWFAAVELAWDAIDRRAGTRRTTAYSRRRVNEVATVVTLAALVAAVGASTARLL